jgi:LysR family glycine cleavage system transcriptional activator
VVISTPAAMGRWWLGRRLADLTRAFPETRFEIRTGKASADVSEADLVVHVGEPAGAPESGLDRRVLFDVPIYPVCAPGLLSGLPDERDLSTLPRIENLSVPWSLLFDELDDTGVALVVDDAELAVQAALDGAGVALAHDLLVRDLIADGRLRRRACAGRRFVRLRGGPSTVARTC